MINYKENTTHSAKELKARAKQDVMAPSDYNEMIFQLKAFTAIIKILFRDKSMVPRN